MAPTTPIEPLWESDNPYKASAQTDLKPPNAMGQDRLRFRGLVATLVILQCLILIGGMIAERIEHESIVVSGALLLFVSAFLFLIALRRHFQGIAILAFLGIVFPLGIFFRIYFGELSPTESEKQHWLLIQSIGGILLLGQAYLSARGLLKNKANADSHTAD